MTEVKDPIKRRKLYDYLSQNKMTDLSFEDFSNEYASNKEKQASLYSYLSNNKMTDLDSGSFSQEYFGDVKKKETSDSLVPTVELDLSSEGISSDAKDYSKQLKYVERAEQRDKEKKPSTPVEKDIEIDPYLKAMGDMIGQPDNRKSTRKRNLEEITELDKERTRLEEKYLTISKNTGKDYQELLSSDEQYNQVRKRQDKLQGEVSYYNELLDEVSKDTNASYSDNGLQFFKNIGAAFGVNNEDEKVNLSEEVKEQLLLDISGDSMLSQKIFKGTATLEEKENLISRAKVSAIKKKEAEIKRQIDEVSNSDVSDSEKKESLLKIQDDYYSLLGQVGVDRATGILNNTFKKTDELENFNSLTDENATANAVSTFVNGLSQVVGKYTVGFTADTMASIGDMFTDKNDYSVYDAFSDTVNNALSYQYAPTSKNERYRIVDEDGNYNINFGSVTTNLAETLPFTLLLINEAKRGKTNSIQKTFGQLLNPKGLKGRKEAIGLVDTAFRASYSDNLKESRRLGLSGIDSFYYAGGMSAAEGLSELIMPDTKFLGSSTGVGLKGLFAESLKKGVGSKAKQQAAKTFFTNILKEVGEEEAILATGDILKSALIVGNQESGFFDMKQQKELLASTVLMSGALGGTGLPSNININKKELYNSIAKNSTDLKRYLNEELNRTDIDADIKQKIQGSIDYVDNIKTAIDKSPKNVSPRQVELLIKKNNLQKQKEGLDSSFHGPINEEIKKTEDEIANEKPEEIDKEKTTTKEKEQEILPTQDVKTTLNETAQTKNIEGDGGTGPSDSQNTTRSENKNIQPTNDATTSETKTEVAQKNYTFEDAKNELGILEKPIYYYKFSDVVLSFKNKQDFVNSIKSARRTFSKNKRLNELSNFTIEKEFGNLENYYDWVIFNREHINEGNNAYDSVVDKLPVDEATKKEWKNNPENLELNIQIASYQKNSSNETKTETKKINPKGVKGQFDVTIENGKVTKVVNSKGREIPKFVERKTKSGTKLVKNGNYSKIEAEATGGITENQAKTQERGENPTEGNEKEKGNQNQIDDTVQAQGMGKSEKRDLSLSENGPVKNRSKVQDAFKRFWNNTFRSNQGVPNDIARIVRSLMGEKTALTDALEYEASTLKKVVKKAAKGDVKKIKAINDFLSGDSSNIDFLSKEQQDTVTALRARIDNLSEQLIGKLKDELDRKKQKLSNLPKNSIAINSINESIDRIQNLINTIQANKGQYLYRSYEAFVNPKYIDGLLSKNVNAEGKRRIENAAEFISKENNISIDEAREQVIEYLDGLRDGKDFMTATANGNLKAPFLKKRKDIPEPIRELLGESKDPIYNYVNTVYKVGNYLASLEYQSNLTETLINQGTASYTSKQGYTRLAPKTQSWGAMGDVFVPIELKQSIDDMMPLKTLEEGFYKQWVKLAGLTKVGKTVFSPTTTARNIISGIFLSANAGFNPFSPKLFEGVSQAWGTKKNHTQRNQERQKLIKLGILKDGALSGEIMETLNDFKKTTARISKKSTLYKIIEVFQKLYALGDDSYKVVGFYAYKNAYQKTGMSEAEAEKKAAERVTNTFPTYSMLPKNIQKLRRVPIVGTFVSFPYEVFRTTFNGLKYIKEDFNEGRDKMALQQIAGMAIANGTLPALSAITKAMQGIDDDDDDFIRNGLPDWQKNSSLIYTNKVGDKPRFIDGTALFPGETIMKPLRTLLEEREGRELDDKAYESIKEVATPFIGLDISFQTAIDLVNNNDSYDRDIYEGNNLFEGVINDPDKIFNYIMKQAGPGIYNNISEFARSNNSKPEFFGDKNTSYGREYTNQDALFALLGFRFSTINYSNLMTNSGYEAKDEYSSKRNEVNKKLKTTRKLNENDINKMVDEYEKINKDAYERILIGIKGARKLGMTDYEIMQALKQANISKRDFMYLASGAYPPLKPIDKSSYKKQIDKLRINYKGKENQNEIINNYLNNVFRFNVEVKTRLPKIRKSENIEKIKD